MGGIISRVDCKLRTIEAEIPQKVKNSLKSEFTGSYKKVVSPQTALDTSIRVLLEANEYCEQARQLRYFIVVVTKSLFST